MESSTNKPIQFVSQFAIALNQFTQPKVMMAIQGPGGSGKTTSALTFPSPIIVAAFEPGLEEHRHREDVFEVQFYNPEVTDQMNGGKYKAHATKSDAQSNKKDAFIWWLKNEGLKIPKGNTFLLDSWSSMQDGFDIETTANPSITKKGSEDGYAFWAEKNEYSLEVMSFLYSMKCNVVVTFHEIQNRDKTTGALLEKIQPLMQGKFFTQLKRFFPYFYRMLSIEKKDKEGKEVGCEFFWQIKSSNSFDAKTGITVPDDVFKIAPTYQEFSKYLTKKV